MIQYCSIIKVAEVFFREPTVRHSLKDVSRKSYLAHTSVKSYLTILLKENIIERQVEKRGKRAFPFFIAKRDHPTYILYKKEYNFFILSSSGILEFLRDHLTPKSIILFGSYARGDDRESSDIDLFIESKSSTLSLEKFEKILGREIELHFQENFNTYPSELKNNIINGQILYGYLEVFK